MSEIVANPGESIDKGSELQKITFIKHKKPDGSVEYTSKNPNRKEVVLEDLGFEPKEGHSYDVVVTKDSEPVDPMSGKYLVKIKSEDGVPIEIKKQEKVPQPPPLPIEINEEAGVA